MGIVTFCALIITLVIFLLSFFLLFWKTERKYKALAKKIKAHPHTIRIPEAISTSTKFKESEILLANYGYILTSIEVNNGINIRIYRRNDV